MSKSSEVRRGAAEMPSNLHLSVRCPQSEARRLSERMEQKFFVAPKNIGLARALVQRVCRVDPRFPAEQINSVYFDTVDLDQHERSLSGELVKDKVRIRWYGDEHDPHGSCRVEIPPPGSGPRVPVWLELKSRRGFSSTKQRLSLTVSPDRLEPAALTLGVVPRSILVRVMASFGFFSPGPLRPIIVISYFRRRFVEPLTGYGVAMDSHIRSTMLLPGTQGGERGLELPGAVIEVKCPGFELPPALRQLAAVGSSWSRYSKYSGCLDAHDADRGTVSRLWPSGLSEGEPGMLSRIPHTARGDRPPQRPGREPAQEPTRRGTDAPWSAPLLEEYETE
jgi:hypothetical protein